LERLLERGRGNGARDIRIMSAREVRGLEPNVTCRAALWCPSSGIIDAHALMRYFETTARSKDTRVAYRSEVKSIEKAAGGFRVGIEDAQGEVFPFTTRVLVNSAGLESGNIAALAGIDIDEAGYRVHYCKGEFFRLAPGKHSMTARLIYPFPPHGGSVGIHTVPDVEGMMRLGPYSYFVDSIDYAVDDTYKEMFHESVKPFLPFVELEDLEPDTSGMLPKIQKPGGPARDFVIIHEDDRGLEGLINLVGIESPGLTSSPAIGRMVSDMIEEIM
ncbi:MAG: FAD-dependent oxidoreductase, partial [Dehalococcoidia bacterium]|nr:FAD-dependent oxidoreductase [Dehalococcoidia bacterium]